uniref:Gag-pol polyprotein n=1 Tax=Solanum tuberosum TaxID=4113 RepID=M1DSX4_SOLTU
MSTSPEVVDHGTLHGPWPTSRAVLELVEARQSPPGPDVRPQDPSQAMCLSSTDAYSTLHLLVVKVQELSTQITHRSVPDLRFSSITGHQALSHRGVFQAPEPTQLGLSVVRTIWASVLHERKDVLDVVSEIFLLLNRINEAIVVGLSIQLQQHQQVARLRACRDGFNAFFKRGQTSQFMRECPKNMKGNGNRGNRAQSSLAAPVDKVSPKEATSGTGG